MVTHQANDWLSGNSERNIIMSVISIILIAFCFLYTGADQAKANPKALNMTDAMGKIYWVSSELDAPQYGFGKYGAHNLFDQNNSTAWVEGKAQDGVGEKIVVLHKGAVSHLLLVNGYAKNERIYKANNRIRELRLTVYPVKMPSEGNVTESAVPVILLGQMLEVKFILKDQPDTQLIPLPQKLNGHLAFELTIESVYRGTRYRDTCLSELKLINQREEIVIKNNDHEIWVGKNLAIKNEEEVFQLIEASKGDEWAIFISMPTQSGGRADTSYHLFSAKKRQFISIKELDELYGFTEIDGKLFLEGFSNQKNEVITVDLQELAH